MHLLVQANNCTYLLSQWANITLRDHLLIILELSFSLTEFAETKHWNEVHFVAIGASAIYNKEHQK